MAIDANRQITASGLLQRIEDELRRLKYWQNSPLPADRFVNMGAFGSRTMSFPQWLQFVFVPAVRDTVAGRRDWPGSSEVGTIAVREFDGVPETATLVDLLNQFDALAGSAVPPGPCGVQRGAPTTAPQTAQARDARAAGYLGGIALMAPAWLLAALYPLVLGLLAPNAPALATWERITAPLIEVVDAIIPQVTTIPFDLTRHGFAARAPVVHHALAMQWLLSAVGLPFGLAWLWRVRRRLGTAYRARRSRGGWVLRVGLDRVGAAFVGLLLYAVPNSGGPFYAATVALWLASGSFGFVCLAGSIAVFWLAVYTVVAFLLAAVPYRRRQA